MRIGDPRNGWSHLFNCMPKWIKNDPFVRDNWSTCVFMCQIDFKTAQARFQTAHFRLDEAGDPISDLEELKKSGRGVPGGEPAANEIDWMTTGPAVMIRAVTSHAADSGVLVERTTLPVGLDSAPLASCLFHATTWASFQSILIEDEGIMPGTPGAGGLMTHFAVSPPR